MKNLLTVSLTIVACFPVAAAQPDFDPSRVDIYITPYYNSAGPAVSVGRFSAGLASKSEAEFLATISKMKQAWEQLSFPALYVAAIRLYDFGYRKKRFIGFTPLSIAGASSALFWIRSRREVSAMRDLSCSKLKMPSSSWPARTSMGMPLATRMLSSRLSSRSRKKDGVFQIYKRPTET
jgi:hypothetical protein